MRRRFGSIVALGVLTMLSGCVERRFRIESTPPGAAVFVNNESYGSAPVDVPFTYYGMYNITLMKEGFQTRHIKQEIKPPWYQYPPIDFFAESIWPWQLTDNRPLHFEMQPLAQPNLDEIKRDAEELRGRSKNLPPPRYPNVGKDNDKPTTSPAPLLPNPTVIPPIPKGTSAPPLTPME